MPPLVALAIEPCSPPLRPLEQVLRDRHAHVFVLAGDDPLAQLDEALPDVVVFTSPAGARLARAIRERLGPSAPRLIAIFPEYDEADATAGFDEGLAETICSRTLARVIAEGTLREPSGRGPGSSAEARS